MRPITPQKMISQMTVTETQDMPQQTPICLKVNTEDRAGDPSTPVPSVASVDSPTAEENMVSKGDQDENLMDQLLPEEDMELNTSGKRSQSETEDPIPKRQKTAEEPTFDISLVAVNGLVEAIQGLREDVAKGAKTTQRIEKALVESNVMMSKMMDIMTRLKNTLDNNEKEERRREERRQEADRRREEERRREREEDRRREDRRRESERRDREEKRRMEASSGSGHGEDRKKEEKRDDADKRRKAEKENEPRMKSVLGRSYTENGISDYGRKR
ncbi:MAG: hypothetical protein AB2693_32825 [Candidatus Thiodiazotropha sp.]